MGPFDNEARIDKLEKCCRVYIEARWIYDGTEKCMIWILLLRDTKSCGRDCCKEENYRAGGRRDEDTIER